MNIRSSFSSAIFALCFSVALHAATVELALDLNTIGPGKSSNPKNLVAMGATLFFTADDGIHGTELWKSNGTPQSTTMALDLQPGPRSSNPQTLTVIGNALYFSAVRQNQLQLLKLSVPGMQLQKIAGFARAERIPYIAVSGANVFFSLCESKYGCELWIADEASGAARLVKDIHRGPDSSYPSGLTALNGKVIFDARDTTHGNEVWCSDGSESGTILLQDIATGPNSSFPGDFVLFGNSVVFSADDQERYGWELWKSDGTPEGTTLLADIIPGPDSANPIFLTPFQDQIVFAAYGQDNREHLWVMNAKGQFTILPGDYGWPDRPVSAGKSLFFIADDQLWTTDLTSQGTRVVDYDARADSTSLLGAFQGKAVYHRYPMLKVTDGTVAGTHTIAELDLDIEDSASSTDRVYFAAGPEWWNLDLFATNGTAQGTGPLGKTRTDNGSSDPETLRAYNGFLYFLGTDGNRKGLWRTRGDGSAQLVFQDDWIDTLINSGGRLFFNTEKALYRIDRGGPLQRVTPASVLRVWSVRAVGRKVFFIGSTVTEGSELWVTDGTPGGTRMLKSLTPGSESSYLWFRSVVNNQLFFTASFASGLEEVWRSDGTPSGTFQVASTSSNATFAHFFTDGGKVYMIRKPADHSEIWAADGSANGTAKLGDIQDVRDAALVYPNFYFTLADLSNGQQLWRFHIPSRTSSLVTPLFAGTQPGTSLASIFPFGNFLMYESAGKLWRTDGTGPGTIPLQNLAEAGRLMESGSLLYMRARTPGAGRELWVTDGTAAGTRLLADAYRGPYDSNPAYLTVFNNTIYFAADSASYGREIYRLVKSN